jgi:hypothetical protein
LPSKGARLASYDKEFEYRIFRLDRPMAPGETRQFNFRTQRWRRGFRKPRPRHAAGAQRHLPQQFRIRPGDRNEPPGRAAGPLQAPQIRASGGASHPEARRSFGDEQELYREWTTADITVSTAADQTPIAPGKKVSEVVQGGRRTARFVSEAPILNFFSIQSARYAERHRKHAGVDLAIYYHATHDRNVDRMLNALQTSLDYYQANFGPYQFDQVRIIEFPGLFDLRPGIRQHHPYSENFGFVGDFSDPEKIDYATYVTAHELAHQYWGHQIAGGDAGRTLLVETLSQYSALMVMKKTYGEDQIRRFLKVGARRLSAQPEQRGSGGAAARGGSRTSNISITARARWPCTCSRSGWARMR